MRRTLVPFVIAVGLISAGLSASTVISEEDLEYNEDSDYDPLDAEYAQRAAAINAEIDAGSTEPWAGEYFFGDGLGVNVTLVIAPDSGFVFVWTGCVGVYGRSFGSVSQQNGRLVLNHVTPNQPGLFGNFSNVLVPVRMGERLYLVGEEQMGDFESCEGRCAQFLLRNGDRDLMARRIPEHEPMVESPQEWLVARVSRIIEPDLDVIDGEFRWRKALVELDSGRNRGLSQGMEFFSTTAGWITDTITILQVNQTNAIATVSAYDMLPIRVGSGTCVANYYDDSIEKRADGQPQDGCDYVDAALADAVVAER